MDDPLLTQQTERARETQIITGSLHEEGGEVAERGLDAVNWLALQLVDVDSYARQRSRSVTTPTALPNRAPSLSTVCECSETIMKGRVVEDTLSYLTRHQPHPLVTPSLSIGLNQTQQHEHYNDTVLCNKSVLSSFCRFAPPGNVHKHVGRVGGK